MAFALDTNTIIHIMIRTPETVTQRNAALKNGSGLIIPPYVNYEMLRGFRYVNATSKQRSYMQLCSRYPVGEMKRETWELAASIYAELRQKGYTVGDADILIAAFCLHEGHTLVTNNIKDFKNIQGLQLTDWTK